jgi:hypothetical protein
VGNFKPDKKEKGKRRKEKGKRKKEQRGDSSSAAAEKTPSE